MLTKKTQFISVEMAIKTDHDPATYVKHFESDECCVQVRPDKAFKHYIYFDLHIGGNANEAIFEMCALICALPDEVRQVWDSAGWRQFHAGYHVGEEPNWFPENIELETLQACCELGAEIGIAMYPAETTDEEGNHPNMG